MVDNDSMDFPAVGEKTLDLTPGISPVIHHPLRREVTSVGDFDRDEAKRPAQVSDISSGGCPVTDGHNDFCPF